MIARLSRPGRRRTRRGRTGQRLGRGSPHRARTRIAAPGNDAVANAVRGALTAELAFPMALPDWKDLAAKVEAEEVAKAAASA